MRAPQWWRRRRHEDDESLRKAHVRVHKAHAEMRQFRQDNHFAEWVKDALEGR